MFGNRGSVAGLYTCSAAGAPMISHEMVEAIESVGLKNDRYAIAQGSWSKAQAKKAKPDHVTLIAAEAIEAVAELLKKFGHVPFTAAETRRNIVTRGIDPNGLVQRRFMVAGVHLRGIEPAHPCQRPSKLAGKDDFELFFRLRGGLRAEILVGGIIKIGSPILI